MCYVQTVYNLLGRLWGYLNVHSVPSGVDDMQCIMHLWRLVMWKLQILLRQEAMCSVLMCFRRWWGGNVVGHDTSPGPDPAPCIINRRDLIHHQCCVLHKKTGSVHICAGHRMACTTGEKKASVLVTLGLIQVAASTFAPDSPYCQPPSLYIL